MTYAVPRVLVLTDRTAVPPGRTLLEVVEAALDGGAGGIVVRERDLPPAERTRLVAAVHGLADPRGAWVVVASGGRSPDEHGSDEHGADEHGADEHGSKRRTGLSGVHLRARDPLPAARPPLLGRSCHDATELAGATADGVDYVTLSPVAPSPSKPGYGPALGRDGFARLLDEVRRRGAQPPPVLALGGVDPDIARAAVLAGASGVAVMGGVMRAADPTAYVRSLVTAVDHG